MQLMAQYINISKETMKDIIDELDSNGDGTISLQEWSEYIDNIQQNIKDNNQNKIKRRKSILQIVVEDRMLQEQDLNLNDQVEEWMRLQDDNKNI